jgi:hypothetical protein
MFSKPILLGFVGLFAIACGSSGGGGPNPGTAGTAGTTGTAGTGTAGDVGTGGGGAGGTTPIVVTPEGMLFMDDFEGGAAKWEVTQGTCSIQADTTGTNVFQCIDGGNEARALAGQIGWGEYTVQARVKLNAMGATRRIYLAARFTDSNNWYGAAIYNGTPMEVQVRKKVAGASSEIAATPYPFVIADGSWYTLKLEVKGSTLKVSVNDVLQLTVADTQFNSGRVALLVDRSDISWDDVIVTNP